MPTTVAAVIVSTVLEAREKPTEDQGAQNDLQGAEPEDEAPQGAKALPGQLDADGEQQEDHAELGEARGSSGLVKVTQLTQG